MALAPLNVLGNVLAFLPSCLSCSCENRQRFCSLLLEEYLHKNNSISTNNSKNFTPVLCSLLTSAGSIFLNITERAFSDQS